MFVVERYRSPCTLSRVRTSRVCAICTKPYAYTRLAHIFGHMEFVDVAREFIHSFATDVDISRPSSRVSSVLALETRSTSSRESVRDVERDDARNRARASRARARDPFHSSVPAVRRDNSSGRLDFPTRRVDARER